MKLLFLLCHWHGLAKLRMHTEDMLRLMESETVELGNHLRTFTSEFREAMSTIWRTWTQRSGLYTNDNEVLTHLSRRFKLEVINRRWFDSSWIEQRVNRR